MKKVLLTLIIITCLGLLEGCAVTDTAEIKQTVKDYNVSLIQALEQGNAQVLTDCTTEKQQGRVFIFVGELLKSGRLLKAQLEKMEIIETSKVTAKDVAKLYTRRKERLEKENLYVIPLEVSDQPHAILKTKETWTYTYINKENGKPVGNKQKISYENVYFLILQDGKWLVDNLDAIEVSPAD